MKRRPVEWLAAPGEDDNPVRSMTFRLIDEWVATDSDQLILPIRVYDKTDLKIEEPFVAILKQYGGEGLLNDMLMSDQDLMRGSVWTLWRREGLLSVEPGDTDDIAADQDSLEDDTDDI